MKNLSLIIAIFAISYACAPKSQNEEVTTSLSFPESAKKMNIYEVNVRQYTEEGTLKAFIPHIKRLKSMGVDILWLMPVQEVGRKNRKGELGSYYSIRDYTSINKNFGSLDDFKKLVKTAHQNDMLVLLDWVANHTAYDHHWAEEHRDFYNLDSLGELQSPVKDWTDVADLNYDNPDLHDAMIEEMEWWLTNTNIDGFRCDVAGMVPDQFWEKAIDSLEQTKDIFMLAEWDEPKMHRLGFDMTYGWEFHHLINGLADGSQNADSLQAYLENDLQTYPDSAFRMYFTSNHDENSWNGTVFERLGPAYEVMAVLTYTLPRSMPLLYGGQEAALDKRLHFFKKDTIDFSALPYQQFYSDLNKLKHTNPALWNGAYGGSYERLQTEENSRVFAFTREKGNNTVKVFCNLSPESVEIERVDLKNFVEFKKSENAVLDTKNKSLTLEGWDYLILTSE